MIADLSVREPSNGIRGAQMAKSVVTRAKAGAKKVGSEALGAAAKAAAGVVLDATSKALGQAEGRSGWSQGKASREANGQACKEEVKR